MKTLALMHPMFMRTTLLASSVGLFSLYWWQSSSQPDFAELSAPAHISINANAIREIQASSMSDAIYLLGYSHALDHFAQMDHLRRRALGQLSLSAGESALNADAYAVKFQFAKLAEQVVQQLPPHEKAWLSRYVAGVNAGMAQARLPFAYLAPALQPEPWQLHDPILVNMALYLLWQPDQDGSADLVTHRLWQQLALADGMQLLGQASTAKHAVQPAEPGLAAATKAPLTTTSPANTSDLARQLMVETQTTGWDDGLVLYPVAIQFAKQQLEGLSIPGLPLLIAGRNATLSWSFNLADGDYSDVLAVPQGPEFFQHSQSLSKQQQALHYSPWFSWRQQPISWQTTEWGPVLDTHLNVLPGAQTTANAEVLVLRWVATASAAHNLQLMQLWTASSVDSAIAKLPAVGFANGYVLLADQQQSGWVQTGLRPNRQGFSGLSVTQSALGIGWQGWQQNQHAELSLTSFADQNPDQLIQHLSQLSARQQQSFSAQIEEPLQPSQPDGDLGQSADIAAPIFAAPLFAKISPQTDLRRWQHLLLRLLQNSATSDKTKQIQDQIAQWHGDNNSAAGQLIANFRQNVGQQLLQPLVGAQLDTQPWLAQERWEQLFWRQVIQQPEQFQSLARNWLLSHESSHRDQAAGQISNNPNSKVQYP